MQRPLSLLPVQGRNFQRSQCEPCLPELCPWEVMKDLCGEGLSLSVSSGLKAMLPRCVVQHRGLFLLLIPHASSHHEDKVCRDKDSHTSPGETLINVRQTQQKHEEPKQRTLNQDKMKSRTARLHQVVLPVAAICVHKRSNIHAKRSGHPGMGRIS